MLVPMLSDLGLYYSSIVVYVVHKDKGYIRVPVEVRDEKGTVVRSLASSEPNTGVLALNTESPSLTVIPLQPRKGGPYIFSPASATLNTTTSMPPPVEFTAMDVPEKTPVPSGPTVPSVVPGAGTGKLVGSITQNPLPWILGGAAAATAVWWFFIRPKG